MEAVLSGVIDSLQTGKPAAYQWEGKEWVSGLRKAPVEGRVFLSALGFDGDGQADLVYHGGRDKAVCVYCREHYSHWESILGQPLGPAAFGENVTVKGLSEETVRIGDIFKMGEAVVQVSQPRQPCYKLGYRYSRTDLPLLVQETGYTGYYFRVLEDGFAEQGAALQLLGRAVNGITVEEANQIMYREKTNRKAILRLLEVRELSDSWRQTLNKRLGGIE